MKIAIIGYGEEGKAAYDYWHSPDNQLTVCDQNEQIELPNDVERQLGDNYLDDLDRFDLIVRSPGVHPSSITSANSPEIVNKITSGTNEFFKVCPTKNIIGVTGTKGKGTTTTLIARLIEATGKTTYIGGNIGIAPLNLLKKSIESDDWVVLEMSNFQLIDMQYSPHIAVCVMVVPEHLNWHASFEEYIAAKQNLFRHQTHDDIAIYFSDSDNSIRISSAGNGKKIPYFAKPGAVVEADKVMINDQIICDVNELQLLGKHNWQNVCAAVTAIWQITQDISVIRPIVTSFKGLEHRIEFVKESKRIKYYNDSFATGPDASIAAIEAIAEPKVMIIGGFDRQLPLEHFAQVINEHVNDIREVVLIGESADRLAEQLDIVGFQNYIVNRDKSMPEIVTNAKSFAKPGDALVLSPGFASFDMFKNFEVRGQQYKEAVAKL